MLKTLFINYVHPRHWRFIARYVLNAHVFAPRFTCLFPACTSRHTFHPVGFCHVNICQAYLGPEWVRRTCGNCKDIYPDHKFCHFEHANGDRLHVLEIQQGIRIMSHAGAVKQFLTVKDAMELIKKHLICLDVRVLLGHGNVRHFHVHSDTVATVEHSRIVLNLLVLRGSVHVANVARHVVPLAVGRAKGALNVLGAHKGLADHVNGVLHVRVQECTNVLWDGDHVGALEHLVAQLVPTVAPRILAQQVCTRAVVVQEADFFATGKKKGFKRD